MALEAPPLPIAAVGLRALKTVAQVDGVLHPLERDLLESVQRFILQSDLDLDALEPIAPDELAAAVPEGPFRPRIVHGCIMMSLIDGEAGADELPQVDAFARALGIRDASLKDLHRVANGQLKLLRFDLMRRFLAADRLKKEWNERGLRGIYELARVAIQGEDAALAARYQALEQLPDGTLGREYVRFIRENEFSLPGERGSPPELMVFHDCTHVLGSYRTTPDEEALIAAFHAGNRKQDPFGLMLFVVAQFHLGIQITPTTGGLRGLIKPQELLQAFQRGAQINRDLVTGWTPQDDFERPVDELRRELNILPR